MAKLYISTTQKFKRRLLRTRLLSLDMLKLNVSSNFYVTTLPFMLIDLQVLICDTIQLFIVD